MGRIQVLPPALASQIAAGEVVERPASAVKELIENALDAEATRCDVCCEGGGVSLLSVGDDGIGMNEADAALCIERHATSKLKTINDLNRLSTFGFRGEALPSVASVSRFTLRTRARDAEIGLRLDIEAGGPSKITREGMKIGTTIEIRDLFFNVPARRKFLRSTGTESAHVTTAVEGAALSRPDVTFTLTRDGRRVREILRVASRRERVQSMLPEETLAGISGERGPLRFEGYLSRPERARPGAMGLSLVVNGRIVKDRMIAATIAQAYGASLSSGNYPRGVVYLDLPPELVDVNVHPQKTEVRFVEPRALTDAVYSIVSREIATAFSLPQATRGSSKRGEFAGASASGLLSVERPWIPSQERKTRDREVERPTTQASLIVADRVPSQPMLNAPRPGRTSPQPVLNAPRPAPRAAFDDTGEGDDARPTLLPGAPTTSGEHSDTLVSPLSSIDPGLRPSLAPTMSPVEEPVPESSPTVPSVEGLLGTVLGQLGQERDGEVAQASEAAPKSWGKLRFLAQVRLTFLVCEGNDGLYVIDQHAAAERVAFAKLLAQYHSRAMAAQTLLFPVMVDLLPAETDLVDAQQEVFRALGLDVRVRSGERISVHSVPRLLQHASPERLVRDLLGEMTKSGGRGFSSAVEQAIALMACHGSLRAGELLTAVQAQALLTSLDDVDMTKQCTHGRPVVAVMRFTDLERQVGRR